MTLKDYAGLISLSQSILRQLLNTRFLASNVMGEEMGKILLLDLDVEKARRPFPNLALMKLSAYHKKLGDEVWLNFPLCQPDITYVSCVFSWHKPSTLDPSFITGGGGINLGNVLPDAVEHIMPDYSLYPNTDFSMGFTSRGCIRKCPFCIVPEKEGGIKAWADIDEFYNQDFKRLLLLDNNLLAAENWRDTLSKLIEYQVTTDFNQGLDIRLLTDEMVDYLKRIKANCYRFAFDNIAYEDQVRRGLNLLLKAGISPRKLVFYVLVGFSQEDGAIERMKLLQSFGVDIYPMIYKDATGKEPDVTYDCKETIEFHGARGNMRKFLRIVGRLD